MSHKEKESKKIEAYRTMTEHKCPLQELFTKYETSQENGITEKIAQDRNLVVGDNKLSEKKTTPWWILWLKEMVQPFACLLWVAAILCFILYGVAPNVSGAI